MNSGLKKPEVQKTIKKRRAAKVPQKDKYQSSPASNQDELEKKKQTTSNKKRIAKFDTQDFL